MKKALAIITIVFLVSAAISGSALAGHINKGEGHGGGGGGGGQDCESASDITVCNFFYTPKSLNVAPEATITAQVAEGRHTITFVDSSFDSDRKGSGDGEFTFTAPSNPGPYTYYCRVHGFDKMHAVIIVK